MKITVHQGLTVPIPGRDFSSLRYDVTLTDIDLEEDIDKQIEEGLAAVEKVAEAGEKALVEGAANISGLNFEGLGIATQFSKFENKFNVWKENITGEIKRQKEVVDTLTKIEINDTLEEMKKVIITHKDKKSKE